MPGLAILEHFRTG